MNTVLRTAVATSLSAIFLTACSSIDAPSTTPKTTVKPATPERPVVALVLGGGGLRGFAHVGAIQALEENGIYPNMVVGTSAGAIVGSMYAAGKDSKSLTNIALRLSPHELIDFSPSKQGLATGEKLRQYINAQTGNRPIEQLPIRFVAVATDMQDKKAVAFSSGETGLMVQASASVPNFFVPPRIPVDTGKKYIDGSNTALLPAAIAKELGADVVISVDIMANAKDRTNAQHDLEHQDKNTNNTISIGRDDKGITAKWGKDTFNIPIDLSQIDKATKDLPFELPLGEIIGGVLGAFPQIAEIPLPKGLPNTLPKSQEEFYQFLGNIGINNKAKAADIKASDVLIQPQTYKVGFGQEDRQALITSGYQATLAQIPAIKDAIQNAKYTLVGTTQ
ncbi:patatin-like phospholipase family protein [Moraxella sp.]|uniref:patatin-like phospholipase family protein n=1 Tax=Moraxella sp. TaxID=479 RepID=UPI0026DC594E|nr:patatin-like phospholipase family protein [Moraxella sp.]MDO4894710.1 patatin-like phospholipase family protein [Moraxella sp.]